MGSQNNIGDIKMEKNNKPILWLGNGLNRTFEGDSCLQV